MLHIQYIDIIDIKGEFLRVYIHYKLILLVRIYVCGMYYIYGTTILFFSAVPQYRKTKKKSQIWQFF